ncbi:MAG TPA: UPF0149 family protein [Acidobacteriaceae bacterium]|nr:UPF0149 family protein [Acidobacteriaceae bacterium]
MESLRQSAPDRTLSDEEYDRLEEILDRFPSKDAMDLEEMDGFFAALICGPVAVPPSVYLSEIWGGEQSPFPTLEAVEEFLDLTMRHWNAMVREISSPDEIFLPYAAVLEGETIPRGNRWARGFLHGIDLAREGWDEVLRNEDKFAYLIPVFALVHEHDTDPETRSWTSPPGPELRNNLIAGLAVATQRFYNQFHAGSRPAPSAESRRPKRKIGRNEPCPCGSGKKYKQCCAKVTVQ